MERNQASGCSNGMSDARLWATTMSAAIHITSQGRAVIVAIIRGFGGCS